MKIDKRKINEAAALHPHIKFAVEEWEFEILEQIVKRAQAIARKHGDALEWKDAFMDLAACHCNGCPLKLKEMLEADDLNFVHDVFGIMKYMDRETGQLTNCFLPRFYNGEEDQETGNDHDA